MDEKLEMQWYTSIDESAKNPTYNYETLTEVKASVMENMVQRPGVGKSTNSAPTSLADVAATKKCLTIMGLLLAVFLMVSLAAITIAAVAYYKSSGQMQGESSQSKGIQSELGVNYSALVNIVSSELQHFLNESASTDNPLTQMLIMSLSRKVEVFQANLTQLGELHNAVSRNISSLRSDLVTVRNQVTSLQQTSNTAINSVRTEVRNLQNIASRNSSTLMTDLDAVNSQVTNLEETTSGDISSIRMDVSTLQSAASRNSSSIQTQLNTFTISVNSRLATPVNLYQNCRQDTESCTLTHGNEYYKPYCHTSWLSINVTVS